MKHIAETLAGFALLALGAATIDAQARPAAGTRSIAQTRAALKGKWESSLKACFSPSDAYLLIADGSYSGYEFSCSIPAAAYTAAGFSGKLSCAAEGEEFDVATQAILSGDGQRLRISSDNSLQTYVRCPRATENILP